MMICNTVYNRDCQAKVQILVSLSQSKSLNEEIKEGLGLRKNSEN